MNDACLGCAVGRISLNSSSFFTFSVILDSISLLGGITISWGCLESEFSSVFIAGIGGGTNCLSLASGIGFISTFSKSSSSSSNSSSSLSSNPSSSSSTDKLSGTFGVFTIKAGASIVF